MKSHSNSLGLFISNVLVVFILSILWVWYDHLWLPHQKLAYCSQVLPLSAMILVLSLLLRKSWARYLVAGPLALLFVASIVLQTLVWIGLIRLPLY